MPSKRKASKIFISYRRDDAQGFAGRLSDSLTEYFGPGRVFRDIEGIESGDDFQEAITDTLGAADAQIVLIGSKWLTTEDGQGKRRLDDPDDLVVQEIANALERKLPVFPVLLEATSMPRAEELPEPLKALARHNAISISDNRWDHDVTRLAKVLSLDIAGSTIERQVGRFQWVTLAGLYIAMIYSLVRVSWSSLLTPSPPQDASVSLTPETAGTEWAAYTPEDAAVALSIVIGIGFLLTFMAPSINKYRRRYIYTAILVAMAGTLTCLAVYINMDRGPANTMAMFLGSTGIIATMLVLTNLSRFKPK